MLGTTLGNYRLERELGRGGMGAVFVGTHTLLGREAAVKVLLAKYSQDQDIVGRFFNEARAATAIEHPGIVEIYDYGKDASGCAFIVMELCQGESLGARIRRKHRFTVAAALTIVRQIAGTLSAAHKAGIVHRDLKPDNVFVVPDPEVTGGERIKLLDFGIAKLATEAAGPMKTSTGVIMGTPNYMSPEQCRGAGAVDSRADLYSLGCMLFELMCGRVPFVGEGSGDIIGAHLLTAPPKPSSFTPNIPQDIERLILALLAKKPGDRPATADGVVAELVRISEALPQGLETAHAVNVALDPTYTPEALVDPAAATNATSTPAPRSDPDSASTALGHAAAMAPAADTPPPSTTAAVVAVEHASTAVGHAMAPKSADDRRTNDRRASSDDRRGPPRGGSTETAATASIIEATAPAPVRRSRTLWMVLGAAIAITGSIGYVALRKPTVPDDGITLVIGELHGEGMSDGFRTAIRPRLAAIIANSAPDVRTIFDPTSDDATGPRTLVLDIDLASLDVEQGRVACHFQLAVTPTSSDGIAAFTKGGASVPLSTKTPLKDLDAIALTCLEASLTDQVLTKVLPFMRTHQGGSAPTPPVEATPPRTVYEVIDETLEPTRGGPPTDPAPPSLEHPLDNANLTATLRAYRSSMESCYVTELPRDPKLETTAVLRFTIGPTGRAYDLVSVEGNEALVTCIANVIARIPFPKPPGNSDVTFKLPFRPAKH